MVKRMINVGTTTRKSRYQHGRHIKTDVHNRRSHRIHSYKW